MSWLSEGLKKLERGARKHVVPAVTSIFAGGPAGLATYAVGAAQQEIRGETQRLRQKGQKKQSERDITRRIFAQGAGPGAVKPWVSPGTLAQFPGLAGIIGTRGQAMAGYLPGATTGGFAGAVPMIGTVVRGAIRSARGLITRFVLPSGATVSRKQAVALAKQVGLDAAAVALGVTAVELAEAVMQETSRPRRRRGITGRQLANARRVNRMVKKMACDLGYLKGATCR